MPNDPRELGAAPAYSSGLEFTIGLLLRSMEPENKLLLARRMKQVFNHLERQALDELGLTGRER